MGRGFGFVSFDAAVKRLSVLTRCKPKIIARVLKGRLKYLRFNGSKDGIRVIRVENFDSFYGAVPECSFLIDFKINEKKFVRYYGVVIAIKTKSRGLIRSFRTARRVAQYPPENSRILKPKKEMPWEEFEKITTAITEEMDEKERGIMQNL